MFQLTEMESKILKSQFATSSLDKHGGVRTLSYVFTEQGVSMLSAVLNSEIAIVISIQIIKAFTSMRNFIQNNNLIVNRLDNLDILQIEHKNNFDKIFKLLDNNKLEENQGIFFDGQIFDSHIFISKLIKKAKIRIILIDNYINEETLDLFKNLNNINLIIYSKNIDKIILNKFEIQYFKIELEEFNKSHDRFLIIDDEIYHIGASLKDLGKKWFNVNEINMC